MPRSFAAVVAVAALSVALPMSASYCKAADEPLADDQMAPYQFSGVVNADNVYVRSYSGETDYPVAKLSKGDAVTVVGNRFDWLKVLPPPGTFALVGKAWVEIRGDGSVGRVREGSGQVNVRIGSTVVGPPYSKIVTFIKPGDDVQILGQQDEFFKIAPPANTFAYVNRRFVDPVKQVSVVNDRGSMVVKPYGSTDTPKEKIADKPEPDNTAKPGELVKIPPIPSPPNDTPTTDPAAPASQPSEVAVNRPTNTTPTSRPSVDAAGFAALEARFMTASKQPLADQPVDELIGRYEDVLAGQPDKPTQQIAEYRLTGLRLRKDAVAELKKADEARKQRDAVQQPLVAEAAEMSQRMAANSFKRYTAVGTVRASTLPNNGKTLYRLTDPASGRTVVYLDGDAQVGGMDGQFVGVRGTVASDDVRQIKIITPQAIEPVDPAEIKSGVASSGMVPPSLMAVGEAK